MGKTYQFLFCLAILLRHGSSFQRQRYIGKVAPSFDTAFRISSLNSKNKKNLSSSDKERSEEDERRRQRKDDVVIGKTSAINGAKDCSLDVEATEAEYIRQASSVEQEVHRWTTMGMEFLNSLRLEEANQAFDRVFEMKKDAYLWQAGIVKYYIGDLELAAEIFARNGRTYEARFGGPASEERIWLDACSLKYRSANRKKRKQGSRDLAEFPTMQEPDSGDMGLIESRKAILLVRELFAASTVGDHSREVLARARLKSLGGTETSVDVVDKKMWKLSSWFYLGLHYDSLDDTESSKKCMKKALQLCPSSGKSNDIIHTLPLLHMTVRDWFDDDDMDMAIDFDDSLDSDEKGFSPKKPNQAVASMAYADPLLESSIQDGVSKLKRSELQDALRLRGKTTTGSKEELQERLFYSLMEDAGYSSGFEP